MPGVQECIIDTTKSDVRGNMETTFQTHTFCDGGDLWTNAMVNGHQGECLKQLSERLLRDKHEGEREAGGLRGGEVRSAWEVENMAVIEETGREVAGHSGPTQRQAGHITWMDPAAGDLRQMGDGGWVCHGGHWRPQSLNPWG